ncbi:DeoR/GlpR family DNA-binding transcription regulator [Pseudoroseicyclus aestuarii]|uniref:RpiR family transcriptional regulator n=1 Tax=Pseudoroseicyclus aestuarii TaxID=1795041 RepID=A0A318SWC9_9RHOB|nr:DeoR/GlpR family DNA-binding transcription regulator [Pseudoroseicyclus aestuarii]PYE85675.1 RpiR family transcriptional regulator [Pseudoroseicyclus aestuarii]
MAGSSDDLMTLIDGQRPVLTPKLRGIADFALSEPERFIRSSSRELCATLGTSEPTLIRFCRSFGHSGLAEFRIDLALSLARGRGQVGASRFVEPQSTDRRRANLPAKRRIAQAAAALVTGDNAILIDNGSTAEFFAEALAETPPLTIMTSGLMVAQNALRHGTHEVMLTGGRIRRNHLSLSGRLVETALSGMRFDTFVMGADSVDPTLGLSTFREDEAHQTRAMVEAANRVIVLADSTKFLKPALHKICDLAHVSVLVTDMPEGGAVMQAIEAQGIAVLRPDPVDDAALAEAPQ